MIRVDYPEGKMGLVRVMTQGKTEGRELATCELVKGQKMPGWLEY